REPEARELKQPAAVPIPPKHPERRDEVEHATSRVVDAKREHHPETCEVAEDEVQVGGRLVVFPSLPYGAEEVGKKGQKQVGQRPAGIAADDAVHQAGFPRAQRLTPRRRQRRTGLQVVRASPLQVVPPQEVPWRRLLAKYLVDCGAV